MKTFLLGTLFTNLSPSNQKIGTTSDDASAETLSNVVTKSDFNVILLCVVIRELHQLLELLSCQKQAKNA